MKDLLDSPLRLGRSMSSEWSAVCGKNGSGAGRHGQSKAPRSLFFSIIVILTMSSVKFAEAQSSSTNVAIPRSASGAEGPLDPGNILANIERQSEIRNGLFSSPIQSSRDRLSAWKKSLYDRTNLKLGLSFHTAYQYADDVLPGTDDEGWASDLDFVGSWGLVDVGQPTEGVINFMIEGRWNYGTTGPQTIGFANVASAGGTANTFEEYNDPTVILRNLYWQQGGAEAGWGYRVGKITIDAVLATSRHLSPNATFLSNAGTGFFSNALPDSGFGAFGTYYFDDARGFARGVLTDSNADRSDFGDIGEGDFYTALELGYKILPKTKDAGYSKLVLWHTDGTSDGTPINGNTGTDGWGWSAKYEQELSSDGDVVGVARWGESYDKAAVWDSQAALAVVIYQPFGWFDSDAIGFQANYIDPAIAGSRSERSLEAFYRFPLLPDLETTLAYQYVDNPGYTREIDSANVFSIRFTTSF